MNKAGKPCLKQNSRVPSLQAITTMRTGTLSLKAARSAQKT